MTTRLNNSVAQWVEKSTRSLSQVNIPTAHLDTELLLSHVLHCDRTHLHAHPEQELSRDQLNQLEILLQDRMRRVPLAYIIGKKEFYGRDFIVTPNVLIPRPESETIIDLVKKQPTLSGKCIDIGTGSGCLGITAKLEVPSLNVTLLDISGAALKIAQKNAKKLHADADIIQGDLFQEVDDVFDIVIANLPYVDTSWEHSPETDFEPSLALFAEDGGLRLIDDLLLQLPAHTRAGSLVFLEADPEQHDAIVSNASKVHFTHKITQDYCVILERIA